MEKRDVTQLSTFLMLRIEHFPRLLDVDQVGVQPVPDLRIKIINTNYCSRSVSVKFPSPVHVSDKGKTSSAQ